MKIRKKPKVWMRENIYVGRLDKELDVGYLQLVSYMTGDTVPHLEYSLDKQYRKLGMMSQLLPRYLVMCQEHGIKRMIALVKADNVASIKLLEKNGFIKFRNIEDKISYIRDIKFMPEEINKMIREIKRQEN